MILACWKRYTLDKIDRIIPFVFFFISFSFLFFLFSVMNIHVLLLLPTNSRATISLKTFIRAVGMELFLMGRLCKFSL